MEMKEIIFNKTNGRCFYCNRIGEEIDHFVSRAKWRDWELTKYLGSTDTLENLFLACRKCNRSKLDKCPEDFFGNSFKLWSRYSRANRRVGIYDGTDKENLYGYGGITPMWLEKNIEKVWEAYTKYYGTT